MDRFPDEVLMNILSHLPLEQKLVSRRVCKTWQRLLPLCVPSPVLVCENKVYQHEDGNRKFVETKLVEMWESLLKVCRGDIVLDLRSQARSVLFGLFSKDVSQVIALYVRVRGPLHVDFSRYGGLRYLEINGAGTHRQIDVPRGLQGLKLHLPQKAMSVVSTMLSPCSLSGAIGMEYIFVTIHKNTFFWTDGSELCCIHTKPVEFSGHNNVRVVFVNMHSDENTVAVVDAEKIRLAYSYFSNKFPRSDRVLMSTRNINDRQLVDALNDYSNERPTSQRPKLVFERVTAKELLERWSEVERNLIGWKEGNTKFDFATADVH